MICWKKVSMMRLRLGEQDRSNCHLFHCAGFKHGLARRETKKKAYRDIGRPLSLPSCSCQAALLSCRLVRIVGAGLARVSKVFTRSVKP